MAKTARLKNSNKAPSTHSRASRRASSPTLNLDKSLTTLKPPRSTNAHSSAILGPSRGGGVAKSHGGAKAKAAGKVLRRKQKVRVERGKDRAEAVGDKMERKRGRGRRGVGRNADWDELNERIGGRKGKRRKGGKGDWVDEDMDVDGGKEGLENEVPVTDGADAVDGVKGVEEEIL